MEYPIVEYFYSVQGEGFYSGSPAFFIRFFGCPLKCKFCDTKRSWSGRGFINLNKEELIELAKKSPAKIVVITGGEPCMHNLKPLVKDLKKAKKFLCLETSGIFDASEFGFDWITVSPKLFSKPCKKTLDIADEMKFVISKESEMQEFEKRFKKHYGNKKAIFIIPEWSKSNNKSLLKGIVEFVKDKKSSPYRAGWQLHKNFFVE